MILDSCNIQKKHLIYILLFFWAPVLVHSEALENLNIDALLNNTLKPHIISVFPVNDIISYGYTDNGSRLQKSVTFYVENLETKTYLEPLINDDLKRDSLILALSADGKTANGYVNNSSVLHNAIIWSGDNWDIKTTLGTLNSNHSGSASVSVLSADGKIAGGYAENDLGVNNAIIWSGDNWDIKTTLGTLNSNHSGSASVSALSADGKIAGGYAENDLGVNNAIIWSGDNWRKTTWPDALFNNNSKDSNVSALSADGKIAGGYAENDLGVNNAIIWSGDNWDIKTNLGTLKKDNFGDSIVLALSADGKIAGGYAENDAGMHNAIIWSGNNWNIKTALGTLKNDSSGDSFLLALSADGKIAGGYANDDSGLSSAVIWYGENWQTKTRLGTLKNDNSGNSFLQALSADGKIAAGDADNDAGLRNGVIWYGDNWNNKIELGTLKSDNSGTSSIFALSGDGKVAAGFSDTDAGIKHIFISKINYLILKNDTKEQLSSLIIPDKNHPALTPCLTSNHSAQLSTAITSRLHPEMESLAIIDVTNTYDAIYKLAIDTFSIIDFQQRSLNRLQHGYIAESGNWLYSINTKTSYAKTKDIFTKLNLVYGLTEKISIGSSIEHDSTSSFPKSHEINNNNFGSGFYADYHVSFGFWESYLRPAFSFSKYDLDVKRLILPHTEVGKGNTTFTGLSASINTGLSYTFRKQYSIDWNAGLRYNQINRNNYQENNGIVFPIEYDMIKHHNATGYIGANITFYVFPSLVWLSGIEIAHKIKENDLIYRSQVNSISSFNTKANLIKSSNILKTGIKFNLSKNIYFSVLTSLYQNNKGHQNWYNTFSLHGYF